MGEIFEDSETYRLQRWNRHYGVWQDILKCPSGKAAKLSMTNLKLLDKYDGVQHIYRIIKETTKQEVVYND
jgi:hypothetical protein